MSNPNGSEIAAAWNRWKQSPEGQRCMSGVAEGEYLENRLWWAFMAGVAASSSHNGWIDASYRLPEKKYQTVLVYVVDARSCDWIQTAWMCYEGKRKPVIIWRAYPSDAVLGKVTHWMPLPQVPEIIEKGG